MSKKRKSEIAAEWMVQFFIERKPFAKRLAKVETDLVKEGKYDPKTKRFIFNITAQVDGSPKSEGDKDFDEKASEAANFELKRQLTLLFGEFKQKDPLAKSLNFEEQHLRVEANGRRPGNHQGRQWIRLQAGRPGTS